MRKDPVPEVKASSIVRGLSTVHRRARAPGDPRRDHARARCDELAEERLRTRHTITLQ